MTRLLLPLVPSAVAFASGFASGGAKVPPTMATVQGTVYDSLARRPLEGVTVHFASAENPRKSSAAPLANGPR